MEERKHEIDKFDNIELRSEKVRNVIGKIPQSLVCWGIIIIIVVILVLALVVFFVPYPYSGGETIFEYLFFSFN